MPRVKARNLGRIFKADPRDRLFGMASVLPPAGTDLPTRRSWRFPYKVLDQGGTSTCVGHAWKYFLMCAPLCSNAKRPPSPLEVYDYAIDNDDFHGNELNVDPGRTFGTTVRAGAEALVKKYGLVKQYLFARNFGEVVTQLRANGGVVFGSNWKQSMWDTDKEGIARIRPNSPDVGGHAYFLRKIDMHRSLAWGPQSWGEKDGLNGHYGYPLEDLEKLFNEDGEACVAVEQRAVRVTAAMKETALKMEVGGNATR